MPPQAASTPLPEITVPTQGVTTLRVRYAECDPQGVVHHAAYIPWFELGRTEILRDAGISYKALEDAGVFLVVTKLEAQYKAPAKYDDELEIKTVVTGGGRARIDHAYEVRRVNDPTGIVLVTGTSTIACVSAQGRPAPLPHWLVPPKRTKQK